MKANYFKYLGLIAAAAMLPMTYSCDDDDETIVEVGTLQFESESRDMPFTYNNETATLKFTAPTNWKIIPQAGADWVYFAPSTGKAGKATVEVTVAENTGATARATTFELVSGNDKATFTVRQPEFGGTLPEIEEGESQVIDPATIPDYDKFWSNSEHGPGILDKSSRFSFAHYKSSEHFFVFWDDAFGDDPNAPTVPSNMRVDIDDLLAKAEHFYDTNVNKLGMSTVGEGKSTLDQYKMQIYLLYQEEWLATGSGYDDMIGALWVNPSTCQPVGSTIAHEIGHSFQYQTYADRINTQGAPHDYKSGFRYGFVGPDGAGNGGCGYWEQCAQWQAQRDYPIEQFEGANFPEWIKNSHRHFHHEWMRYGSYWLQSYWVEKHGVELYGRIWKESVAPEDAIMAYTRLYNGDDYGKTREELMDYAMRMASYDIAGAREYASSYQNRYNPTFVVNEKGEFQIAYSSCPGATGFNVIPLTVPENGGKVTVKFRGLEYGAPLASEDKSNMVNGDGASQGRPSNYNAVGGAQNMGWRYGFVALSGETRTYSPVGKDAEGNLSFDVPAGADYLWLVVQGSPERYMSHGWDELESNDPQFPYAITLEGTTLANDSEPLQAKYTEVGGNLVGTFDLSVNSATQDWAFASYDIAEKEVLDFFGLTYDELNAAIVRPEVGVEQNPTEGKIIVLNENADGSYSNMPTANFGYWVDNTGTAVSWGGGQVIFFETSGSVISLGKLGDTVQAGSKYALRPVFQYTKDGKTKTVKYVINYNFK